MPIDTLENILLALLVADAIALAILVLIQHGKGADVGAAFGGGSSNTMFGSAGSTSFLARLTTWLAVGFFGIAFGLAYTAKERAGALSDLGIPTVSAPLSGLVDEAAETLDAAVPDLDAGTTDSLPDVDGDGAALPDIDAALDEVGELTGETESVDSDIPDV